MVGATGSVCIELPVNTDVHSSDKRRGESVKVSITTPVVVLTGGKSDRDIGH